MIQGIWLELFRGAILWLSGTAAQAQLRAFSGYARGTQAQGTCRAATERAF